MKTTIGKLKVGEKGSTCRTGQVMRILKVGGTHARVLNTRTNKRLDVHNATQVEKIEHFFFTFPGNSPLKNCYFIEYGSFECAKSRADKAHDNWSMQYDADAFKYVKENNGLKSLPKNAALLNNK